MRQRLHERWPVDLEVSLADVDSPDDIFHARIVDISESGIRIRMSARIEPGTMVKLGIANCDLYGQTVRCCEYRGAYEIGIEIARVLIGTSDLGYLVKAILAESMPRTMGVVDERAVAEAFEVGDC